MQLILLFSTVLLAVVVVAERPRFRFLNSLESGLPRRSSVLFRKRGNAWDAAVPFSFGKLAEKRRARELFGKRSAPALDSPDYDVGYSPEDSAIYESVMDMQRDRRGRARELFG